MMNERDPESLAAREVIDAITAAHVAGAASQEAVTWAYSKAFEQFRKEAGAWAEAIYEREMAANVAAAKDRRRRRWALWL